MRWHQLAVGGLLALCLGTGAWLLWAQQQEYASGAANLLHIYSDEPQTGQDVQSSGGGVQPSPPAAYLPQEAQGSPSSAGAQKTDSQTVQTGIAQTHTSTAPNQPDADGTTASALSTTSESSAEPSGTPCGTEASATGDGTPQATFSIIGSECGINTPLETGDTVYTLTQKMMEEYPLPDFDYGESGLWQYSVNGQQQDTPAQDYVLEPGDLLEWHPVLPQPEQSTSASPADDATQQQDTDTASLLADAPTARTAGDTPPAGDTPSEETEKKA